MTPFTDETAAAFGARGGRRRTEAQTAALAALHARLRGRQRERRGARPAALLGALRGLVVEGRLRVAWLASEVGVNPKTVRRWLSGEKYPSDRNTRALSLAAGKWHVEQKEVES